MKLLFSVLLSVATAAAASPVLDAPNSAIEARDPSEDTGWLKLGSDVSFVHKDVQMVGTGSRAYHYFATGNDAQIYRIHYGTEPAWVAIPMQGMSMTTATEFTAVARPGSEHMDLFAVGTDGTLRTTYCENGYDWQEQWVSIRPEVSLSPGTPVAAVWRGMETHLDVFVTDASGGIWSTYWEADDQGWRPWFQIDSFGKKMAPGRYITAVWRSNFSHLDLFSIDDVGRIYTAWWEFSTGWKGWYPFTDRGMNLNRVTAISNGDDVHVLVPGGDTSGNLVTKAWTTAKGWSGWKPIHVGNLQGYKPKFYAGTPVRVCHLPDEMMGTITDMNGRTFYTSEWNRNKEREWYSLVDIGYAKRNDEALPINCRGNGSYGEMFMAMIGPDSLAYYKTLSGVP